MHLQMKIALCKKIEFENSLTAFSLSVVEIRNIDTIYLKILL